MWFIFNTRRNKIKKLTAYLLYKKQFRAKLKWQPGLIVTRQKLLQVFFKNNPLIIKKLTTASTMESPMASCSHVDFRPELKHIVAKEIQKKKHCR